MKKNYLKTIGGALIVIAFLLLAYGSGETSNEEKITIDINDKKALENYIQGKWSWEKHTGDVNNTWRYRFEIIGNKIRIWSCLNNTDDPFDMSAGYEELTFSLGEPTRDVDGYKARYLEFPLFENNNFFGLTYQALSPFWLISDDKFDKPKLNCGSGIPSWSRDEFQSIGSKISHGENISSSPNNSNYSESNSNLQNVPSYYDENVDSQIQNDSNYETNNDIGILEDTKIYNSTEVDVKPIFPGGLQKFYRFIGNNFHSPEEAGLSGKVFVSFIIEKDGSLSEIKVLKDIGFGTGKEAIRVLKMCPRWIPAEQNGQKVRVLYSIPITIQVGE